MVRRLAVLLILCAACSLEPVDFTGKRCPCDEGWYCDPATGTCSSQPPDAGDAPRDAGRDGGRDGGHDAGGGGMDAAVDAGEADAGPTDAGEPDAGEPDGGTDAGPPTTTVVIESFTDTYVDVTMPAASFGSAGRLLVDAEPTIFHTLIRPDDLGGAASGSVIESAVLELTCFNEGAEAQVYLVTTTWDESTTWNTRPDAAPSSSASFLPVPVGRVSVDITSIVQAWVDGTPNHGIVIRSSGTDGSDYRSSEYSTAADRPTLTIEYR